jgi:ferredoxin-NADP reductase
MAMVKKYPAEVVTVKQPFEGIYTVYLKSSGKPFIYHPGQFLHLALDEYDPAGGWPESRCFSMQTPPGNDLLRITFAVKGKFTRRMASELVAGSLVTLKLPYGDLFTQDHNKNHTVFIAGGTGITPFLSLFTDSSFKAYSNPVLFAGFRNRSMNIYQAELAKAEQVNPAFTSRYYYEDGNGMIDTDNVMAENKSDNTFFISGPPAMIAFFKQSLQLRGIDLTHIKSDDWE